MSITEILNNAISELKLASKKEGIVYAGTPEKWRILWSSIESIAKEVKAIKDNQSCSLFSTLNKIASKALETLTNKQKSTLPGQKTMIKLRQGNQVEYMDIDNVLRLVIANSDKSDDRHFVYIVFKDKRVSIHNRLDKEEVEQLDKAINTNTIINTSGIWQDIV